MTKFTIYLTRSIEIFCEVFPPFDQKKKWNGHIKNDSDGNRVRKIIKNVSQVHKVVKKGPLGIAPRQIGLKSTLDLCIGHVSKSLGIVFWNVMKM